MQETVYIYIHSLLLNSTSLNVSISNDKLWIFSIIITIIYTKAGGN